MVVPVCLEVSQVVYGWELRLSAEWTVPTNPAGMHTRAYHMYGGVLKQNISHY